MDEDSALYIFAFVLGAAVSTILWVVLSQTPGTIVERGWVEDKGKIYRVVPAEVVEKHAAGGE